MKHETVIEPPMKQIVGYRTFHPDANFNYQFNRWLPYLPEEELHAIAPQVTSLADFKRVMIEYAKTAETEGRISNAAYFYRGAEFFANVSDPDKAKCYQKFQELFAASVEGENFKRDLVPFQDGFLPVISIPAQGKQIDTIVVHGGFDSFIEEFFWMMLDLAKQGFQVILFEGPGQGGALHTHGLNMTREWHQAVGAVLDHMKVDSCTLLGISLGGCLALRAAAKEKRIKRVIADDILEDFFDVLAERLGPQKEKVLGFMLKHNLAAVVNRMMGAATKRDSTTAWAIEHGQHVSGAKTPFEYLKWTQQMNTYDASSNVTQDVLLLGAQEDHLIPLRQLYSQQKSLTNVRSLTTRLFTAVEEASSHCHVGNQPLANRVMVDWITERLAVSS